MPNGTNQPADSSAPAQPVQTPAEPVHGDQPDCNPPGGGSWAWVPGSGPGTGWVPREV